MYTAIGTAIYANECQHKRCLPMHQQKGDTLQHSRGAHHQVDVHGVHPAAACLQGPQLHRVLAHVIELDVLALAEVVVLVPSAAVEQPHALATAKLE